MKAFALSDLPAHLQSQVVPQLHPSLERVVEDIYRQVVGETKWMLPYPPSANAYWRSIVIGGRGRVIVSKEAKAFKKAVSFALQGTSPVSGPVCLTATFYRPRKRGDLDNMLKVLCDSLKGIAYHDDEQITEIRASRKEDKANPRVELSVTQIL